MVYPLGLSFGPTHFTAAHALDSTTIVPVASVECSPAYQEFFTSALKQAVQDNLDTTPGEHIPAYRQHIPHASGLFTSAVLSIKAEAERTLERAVDVKAIATPSYWSTEIQTEVFSATESVGFSMGGAHLLKKLPNALCTAYNVGAEPEEDCFLLWIDYNARYLHFALCEVYDCCLVKAQVHLSDLGEDVAPEAFELQGNLKENAHWGKVYQALTKFMELAVIPSFPSYGTEDRDPKAIILSGEAVRTMDLMGRVVEDFFANAGKGGVLLHGESINPLYAGAIGAAHAARSQVDNPKTTMDFISMPRFALGEPWPP